jgi:hypothetical protein
MPVLVLIFHLILMPFCFSESDFVPRSEIAPSILAKNVTISISVSLRRDVLKALDFKFKLPLFFNHLKSRFFIIFITSFQKPNLLLNFHPLILSLRSRSQIPPPFLAC